MDNNKILILKSKYLKSIIVKTFEIMALKNDRVISYFYSINLKLIRLVLLFMKK